MALDNRLNSILCRFSLSNVFQVCTLIEQKSTFTCRQKVGRGLRPVSYTHLMDRKELFFRLWNALNSLPEIQGRRVDAHLILGKIYRQIAREEGVDKSAVRCSVKCGIERMKKYLQENF